MPYWRTAVDCFTLWAIVTRKAMSTSFESHMQQTNSNDDVADNKWGQASKLIGHWNSSVRCEKSVTNRWNSSDDVADCRRRLTSKVAGCWSWRLDIMWHGRTLTEMWCSFTFSPVAEFTVLVIAGALWSILMVVFILCAHFYIYLYIYIYMDGSMDIIWRFTGCARQLRNLLFASV